MKRDIEYIETRRPERYSPGGIVFIVCSAILFLGAIGIFIWLVVDAAEEHLVKNVLFGAAFLVITIGVLIYAVFVYKAPKTSRAVLWITMILGIASYIVGLCIKTPEPDVDIDGNILPVAQTEQAVQDGME